MFKWKVPIKTLVFLFVSLFVLSLSREIPETNAFLKNTDIKIPLTAAGELKVSLVDEEAVGDLSISSNYSRDIFIKNEGQAAMFVRVLFHPTLESKLGVQRRLDKTEVVPSISEDWVDGSDGYYYYKKKLLAKTSTDKPIFNRFVATTGLEVTDKLIFHFKVEAITTKGTTYRDAWWEGQQPTSSSRPDLQALDMELQILKD